MLVMVPQSDYLPGGAQWSGVVSPGANVMTLDVNTGALSMPPNPGAPSPGGGQFSKQEGIQQKMARQRQLALERRRMAGRNCAGGMAQANQLPAAASALPSKAPGWDRVLGEGIDKPGSLAEKAEAALRTSDVKKSPLVVGKSNGNLQSVDEMLQQDLASVTPVLPSSPGCAIETPEKQPAAKRLTTPGSNQGAADELECMDMDFDFPAGSAKGPAPGNFAKPEPAIHNNNGNGWSLQSDEDTPTAGTSPMGGAVGMEQPAAGSETGGKRWYKPSTWGGTKPKPEPSLARPGQSNNVGAVSSFSSDIQPMGGRPQQRPRTPDSGDGPTFAGPGRRQPRERAQIALIPALPSEDTSSDKRRGAAPPVVASVDFGAMECPGLINDAPVVFAPPAPKVRSNPKHTSGGVDQAAFPQEERRANEIKAHANSIEGKLEELEKKKKAAIGNEDFMEAQRIKGEIEALKSQPVPSAAPAPAPARPVPYVAPVTTNQQLRERHGFATPSPQAQAVQSYSSPPRGNGDDTVEAMLNRDEVGGFSSNKPSHPGPRAREGRPRPDAGARPVVEASGWNMQVDETPQVPDKPAEEPVRKRNWKPWSKAAAPKAAAGPSGPSEDVTTVSAFDGS